MTTDVKTNVIKRNGKEVSFDVSKIVNAITKANASVDHAMIPLSIGYLLHNIDSQSSDPEALCERRSAHP